MSRSANQWQFENAVEQAVLLKRIKDVRDILKILADNTFDTINVPTVKLIQTHRHLVSANKSADEAAKSLCKS